MCIRDRNTLPIAGASLPNAHHNLINNYALPPSAMTNQVSGHPRITSHVNFSVDLYGKITHPIEKILSEILYTDGLSITKLLAFIKYLLQIKDLQQLSDREILQVLLPKCRPPLKDRVQVSLSSQHPVEELHTTLIRHFIPTGIYEELKQNTVLRVQGCLLYTSRCV